MANPTKWKPTTTNDMAPTLEEWVFQALGAASVCWEFPEKAGVFDSDRAKDIGDSLIEHIRELGPIYG